MKKALVLLLGVCFVALLVGSVAARDVANPGLRPVKAWSESDNYELSDPGLRGLYEEAAVDTYCLVWYTFDNPAAMNWQGWTKVDETAQKGIFFHVDDFAGLGTGANGGLYAPEGAKAMWCGVRPSTTDPYLCSWMWAPGYGENWNQTLSTGSIAVSGAVVLSFKALYDSEEEWDFTYVEYSALGGWQELAHYTGLGDTTASYVFRLTQANTKIRFHFTADGAVSDQDGGYNSDGACIIDSITVTDGTYNNYENFEDATLNVTSHGIWTGGAAAAYGSFAGLKTGLIDKDPCGDDFTTQIVFFIGGPISTSYPGLYNTPFCAGPGGTKPPCQNEMLISPVIDMTKYSTSCNKDQDAFIPTGDLPLLGGTVIRFQVYRDLPRPNNVFYTWNVRVIEGPCPGLWRSRGFVYYGPDQDYIFTGDVCSDLLGTNDPVQIGLGAIDLCDAWYTPTNNCAQHTPSPWFDNVRLYRFKTSGPQWSYRDLDFFQDNFPNDAIESYVRADAANDVHTNATIILPGDSIVITTASLLGGGIAVAPGGGPAVYLHVKAEYVGPAPIKPNLFGPRLAGYVVTGTIAAPVTINFNYISDDGVWTIIQCDTARTSGGIVPDRFMVDLNDTLFTRGYQIEYYFTAEDALGAVSYLPRWAGYSTGTGPYFEFLCLPTKNSDVLFVDDFTGRGSFVGSVEDYWMPVFDAVLTSTNSNVDKYDVNGPSSGVSNGPGSRAKLDQIKTQYKKIVWDSGDLETYTISDGSDDKSDDCQMLIDWMKYNTNSTCGLWVCGDDIAYDLSVLNSLNALELMGDYCGVDFVATSYFDETGGRTGGGIVSPLITGNADAGIFVHGGVPDLWYAYGGCFIINQFDVLAKTANGLWAADYPVKAGITRHAAIASSMLNSIGNTVNTMWFGFSYQYVRDNVQAAPIDRYEIAKDVFAWMQNATNTNYTDAVTPKSTKLAQNFPNPFNPSTTIKFDLKDKGFVTLKVYNVAGQLIRTLVNGVRDASTVSNPYTVNWDGTNDRGIAVASGIYFYKLDTKDFSQTKKMVMLR